jgi:hypothetical protein
MSFFEHQRPQYTTLCAHQSDLCDQLCPRYFISFQIAKRDCYRELTDEPLWKLPRLPSTVDRNVVRFKMLNYDKKK